MNGQRGMSTLGAVLLAGTAGLLTATLMMDWMVVDVHVVEDDTPIHIKVPFPLVMADIAAGFIPDELLEEAEISDATRLLIDACFNPTPNVGLEIRGFSGRNPRCLRFS